MLKENVIDKTFESAGTPTTMRSNRGKIFASGNVIDDKYVILDFIGKGAFGEVYRAHQLNLQRDVAIKVVSRDWLQSLEVDDAEIDTALQRFRREVQAMARVRHPNVLQIYDHGSVVLGDRGEDNPVEFIVMEYIPGETMRHAMSEEGFYPEQELVGEWLQDYYLPVLDGVEAIHALDIVHRDLKPENILLDGKTPKISDFGLARSSRLTPVTQSMEVKGTAHYMSPEHFFDFRKADQRADIYSLGKILFEAVTGKIGGDTLPFKTAALPQAATPFFHKLDNIIRDATAENKDHRFDSVARLRDRLLDAIQDLSKGPIPAPNAAPRLRMPLRKPGWLWAGIVAAVLSVAAMTLWHLIGAPGFSPRSFSADSAPPQIATSQSTAAGHPDSGAPPAKTLLSTDGATLHFVPGGNIVLPQTAESGQQYETAVDDFYMDETPVTYHQYVEFLNQNLASIHVENDVVRADEEIWLLLGKVADGFEPVVFQDGIFKVSHAGYALYPVQRVTGYGAAAYVSFYHRRLPTIAEWMFALGSENPASASSVPSQSSTVEITMHPQMHPQAERGGAGSLPGGFKITSVADFKLNKYGIRALIEGFKEWGLRTLPVAAQGRPAETDYVALPAAVLRQPWEGFEKVGFRGVRGLITSAAKAK